MNEQCLLWKPVALPFALADEDNIINNNNSTPPNPHPHTHTHTHTYTKSRPNAFNWTGRNTEVSANLVFAKLQTVGQFYYMK